MNNLIIKGSYAYSWIDDKTFQKVIPKIRFNDVLRIRSKSLSGVIKNIEEADWGFVVYPNDLKKVLYGAEFRTKGKKIMGFLLLRSHLEEEGILLQAVLSLKQKV